MLANTATKYVFRSTDADTAARVAALSPHRPGFVPAVAVRPLATLAPGECYVAVADGRFERRQLEPAGRPGPQRTRSPAPEPVEYA